MSKELKSCPFCGSVPREVYGLIGCPSDIGCPLGRSMLLFEQIHWNQRLPAVSVPDYEELAEKLHGWYLEACKELNPESFNPNAQKSYLDLTEEQKFIDRYIAKKCIALLTEGKDSQ